MTIYLRLWIVTSISIRIDGPKCVCECECCARAQQASERASVHKDTKVFFSHEWRANGKRFALGHNTETWSATLKSQWRKQIWMNLYRSVTISMFHFRFLFHFWHYVSFFSARTWLFFITLLFNCYYQINACNTRKLWNFNRNVFFHCYT